MIVFIDTVEQQQPEALVLPVDSKLNIFTVECGQFVLHEVSTLDKAEFIQHLVLPESS